MKISADPFKAYPAHLTRALADIARESGATFYVTGGAVRDWLKGRSTMDLDLTVIGDAVACAQLLASWLGGAFVPLDDQEGVARVVWQEYSIDFCALREMSRTIEQDLVRRDFTINAMAVAFSPDDSGLLPPFTIIDPLHGMADLEKGLVRATSSEVFQKDPLRLLRAYRFVAREGARLESATAELIRSQASLIIMPAPERIARELELIMASERGAPVMAAMAESGLLGSMIPDMAAGEGVAQPGAHHLDVLDHNLATLAAMETILAGPDLFGERSKAMLEYLAHGRRSVLLKWAALFHDLGKPATAGDKEGRPTFYNHDREGAQLVTAIGRRLRWRLDDTRVIALLVELHMYPFHLGNAVKKTGIKPRACLKLVRAAGEERHGLFLLAMADSLAAQGEGKPEGVEEGLVDLYNHIEEVYEQSVKPVMETKRLLDGNDLIKMGLTPGPHFREILETLEEEQVEGRITSRDQAVAWVQSQRLSLP